MLIETLSEPFVKAFPVNCQKDVFDPITNRFQAPAGDGAFGMGQGGACAVNRLYLMPYGEGEPGVAFLTRLYGWRPVGLATGPYQKQVWVWNVLAQFLCVLGDCPGPRPDSAGVIDRSPALTAQENLCDGLALTAGVLGLTGFVNQVGPGSGFQACAAVELYGCRFVSFDFAQALPGPGGAVTMNCLWARA